MSCVRRINAFSQDVLFFFFCNGREEEIGAPFFYLLMSPTKNIATLLFL